MFIKELRKTLKLRQEEFGERLGVSHAAVSKWEKGETPHPSRVLQICQTFNVNRGWLETGAGEMFVKKEGAEVDEDDAAKRRRFFLETFESLPEVLQDVILDALKSRLTTPTKEEPKEEKSEEPAALENVKLGGGGI